MVDIGLGGMAGHRLRTNEDSNRHGGACVTSAVSVR